ncbi:hypothetical protein SLS58_004151 [Diplodia intermedia]|uniref:RING-type domain-containing protein n=1 Tax=Diplodia intermedia TaxID=856260 RepID=A0ABR3TU79_9PEZI
MPPNHPLLAAPREIIEILSDGESDDGVRAIPGPHRRSGMALTPGLGSPALANAEIEAQWAAIMAAVEGEDAPAAAGPRAMTEDECLERVLEIYPDISHDHVRRMFRGGLDVGMLADSTWCDQLIVRILDEGKYPTEREAKRAALKRKREPADDDFERAPMDSGPYAARRAYQHAALNALQNQYREIPVTFIQQTFKEQGSFYKAFLCLEEADRTYSANATWRRQFRKVRAREPKLLHPTASQEANEAMDSVRKETEAAMKRMKQDAAKRQQEEQKRLNEERNAAHARSTGNESECVACFDSGPTNRMMFCNGAESHYLCRECARNCIHAELDAGRCRPKCCAPHCGANFPRSQLKSFLDPKVFDRLEKLQQQDDLRQAGLENLESCPFCDFQAECEPVEVDREFRCQNGDCGIVSCRLCHLESHTPLTCDEAAKDRKGNIRHQIEEAMTKALVRTCNYICAKSVQGYEHFHNSNGKCPLYDDNLEKRHADEVKAAESRALAEVKKSNPDMTDEELKIKLSESVRKEEQKRIAAAERRHAHNAPLRHIPGDPIPIPVAGGRRGRNALPLDAIHEPIIGAPPRWMDPNFPGFDAFNPPPMQRHMGNIQPFPNVDAAGVNVRRMNLHDAFGAHHGNYIRFGALFPPGFFGDGPAAPGNHEIPQPIPGQRQDGPVYYAQMQQNVGPPGPGMDRHALNIAAAQRAGTAMFGAHRLEPRRQRETRGPATVGQPVTPRQAGHNNDPVFHPRTAPLPDQRLLQRGHDMNLARLQEHERLQRDRNQRQL